MRKREPRVLFFTQDASPTKNEQALADLLGGNVGFRVGRLAGHTGKPEPCDAVAAEFGRNIPSQYAAAEIPRVRSYEDVRKLKPTFSREVGYSDEESGMASFTDDPADAATIVQPSGEGEPGPETPVVVEKPSLSPVGAAAPAARRGRPAGPKAADAGTQPPTTPPAAAAAPVAPSTPAADGGQAPNPPAAAQPPAWGPPPIPPAATESGSSDGQTGT